MNTEENDRRPEEPTPGAAEGSDESSENRGDKGSEAFVEAESGDEGVEEAEKSEGSAEVFDAEAVVEDGIYVEDTEPESELERVTRERDEYLESMMRLKAEFDNSRKRLERERERILQTASERILVSLLPVLDNLDRALQSDGDVRGGVQATQDQLSEVLNREGLLPIESDGEYFDPNLHEAVMSQPSEEHEEGTVLQTFERGYLLNGKAVRVAKVVVAQ